MWTLMYNFKPRRQMFKFCFLTYVLSVTYVIYIHTLGFVPFLGTIFWYRHVQRNKTCFHLNKICISNLMIIVYKKYDVCVLTGHVKSNGNCIGFIEVLFCCCVKSTLLSPTTGVLTSPKVHGELVSILAW